MPRRDPYDVLGIDRDATQEEARKNFRQLARQYHPDRNPGDKSAEARFKEVEEAWTELELILPRSAVPLEIAEGATDEEIEEAYVRWLLDPKNEVTKRPAYAAPMPKEEEARVWSTVAGDAASGKIVPHTGPRGDWRNQKIRKFRERLGLESISAEQAARLLDSHPNAFAVLKIVQQHAPQLCLYDAILARAQPARAFKKKSSATALVIIGAAAVDQSGCDRALQDPIASVEMAEENLHLIAPWVTYAGAVIPAQKLAVDVWFLRENIRELSATLPKRPYRPAGGTSMTAQ